MRKSSNTAITGKSGRKQRLVEFALEAVSRRCEVVRLGHQHVKNGRIKIERAKGSKDVDIKLTPELKAAIEALPKGQMVYAVNSYGKRWSIDGLGNEIRQVGDQGGTAEELPNQWPEERRLAPTGRVQRNRARTAASIGASDARAASGLHGGGRPQEK